MALGRVLMSEGGVPATDEKWSVTGAYNADNVS